ncbi:MAG: bifunctional riboflavin kinase/FAD synthetase [Planctomycetes bacterium]|nr:bifunctional riboflavin kinase/FAD synthetase [Planctomycetota bacterium]
MIRAFDVLPDRLRGGAVSIGNFDGVHRGHAALIERLVAHAHRAGGPAVVFTFDPHPVRLLRPEHAPPPLTWTDRKAELLVELGVDAMIAYPTDEALLALEARQFFDDVICRRLGAKALVEGPNFYFGHDRRGTVDLLAQWTSERGMILEVVPPLVLDGRMVSSSVVRSLIAAGQLDEARQMLTHPYRIRGMVTHGAGRGTKLGFGTANLEAIDTLLPGPGVYAGIGYVNREPWPAAINIGPNPTFGEKALKVEVHLIGWSDPLYGQPLEVDFLARLRDVRSFKNVEELKAQLAADVATAKRIAEK